MVILLKYFYEKRHIEKVQIKLNRRRIRCHKFENASISAEAHIFKGFPLPDFPIAGNFPSTKIWKPSFGLRPTTLMDLHLILKYVYTN